MEVLFPQSKDPFWGVPIVRVRTFLGSILGCPNLGKLPYRDYIRFGEVTPKNGKTI